MSIVFPPNPEIRENAGKTYVDNMKVMLAKPYLVAGKPLELTKKVITENSIEQPPKGWWASPKFDGIRGVWNGKQFVSRASAAGAAKVYSYVPDFFQAFMPPGVALDGEIFCGNGNFQDTSRLSTITPSSKKYTKEQIDDLWMNVKFMVFDSPSHPGPFEERAAFCKCIIDKICSGVSGCPLVWTKHTLIKSEEHLNEMYTKIVKDGGEGVMLRAPGTPYLEKRTNLLLKIKVHDDAEAVVTGYSDGTGKYDKPTTSGGHRMLGSLACKLLADPKVTFNIGVGFTDAMRNEYHDTASKHYIPVGAVVNFSFMEKTREGVPRHPVFRGLRDDIAAPTEPARAVVPPEDINRFLETQFTELVKSLRATRPANWTFKVGQYNKAIDCFKRASQPIVSADVALVEIRKCGQKLTGEEKHLEKHGVYKSSILVKIAEIISTGKLRQVEIAKLDPKVEAVSTLSAVAGVGSVAAGKLYAAGISTIEQLRDAAKADPSILTAHQTLGLKHHDDITKRIPRKAMDEWNIAVRERVRVVASAAVPPILSPVVMLAGSYRRETPDSGDIDILVTTGGDVDDSKRLFEALVVDFKEQKLIKHTLSKGESQTMCIGKLPKHRTKRRVDMFVYSPKVFPFALLHATGSDNHNKSMRTVAIDKGLSLSQYGFKKDGKDFNPRGIAEEADIFKYLGLDYVPPSERK